MNHNVLEFLKEKKRIVKLSMTVLVSAAAVYGGTMFSSSAMKRDRFGDSGSVSKSDAEATEEYASKNTVEAKHFQDKSECAVRTDESSVIPARDVGEIPMKKPRNDSEDDKGSAVESESMSDKEQKKEIFHLNSDKTCLEVRNQTLNVTKIQRIKETLEKYSTIAELVLCDDIIGLAELRSISDVLKVNTTLHKLWLNRIKIGDAEAFYIRDLIANNTTLELLSLKGNGIGAKGAQLISDAIKLNKTLQTLILDENDIGDDGARYIGEALRENTVLKLLGLRKNNIKDTGVNYIIQALEANKKLIIEIHLFSGNTIVDKSLIDRFKQECESHKRALDSQPRSMLLSVSESFAVPAAAASVSDERVIPDDFVMDLQGTKLSVRLRKGKRKGDVQQIKNFLDQHTKITHLNLDDCNIGIDGARMISEVLTTNTNLEELSLNRNGIRSEGTGYLADGLKGNTSLKYLWLQGNTIGVVGVQRISDMIQENNILEKLSLSENELNDEDVSLISEALKKNTTLTKLWLNKNKITSRGALDILSALQTNKVLKWIDLSENVIEKEIINELRQEFWCRRDLKAKKSLLPAPTRFGNVPFFRLIPPASNLFGGAGDVPAASAVESSASSSIPRQPSSTMTDGADSVPAASAVESSASPSIPRQPSPTVFDGVGSVPAARSVEPGPSPSFPKQQSDDIDSDDSCELKYKITEKMVDFTLYGQTDEEFMQFTKQCMQLIDELEGPAELEMLKQYMDEVTLRNK